MPNDLSAELFGRQIRALQERFESLRGRTPDTPDQQHDLLLKTFEEFSTTLEELSVAENELRIQNEELLETRAEVEAERQRYRDLFDMAPDGYIVTDLDGKVLDANRAAVSLFGIAHKHLVLKPFAVFIPENMRADFRALLLSLRETSESCDWEARLRPRVGESFDCAMTISPIVEHDGVVSGLRWQLRDVTLRRRAEAQVQRLNTELEQRVQDRTAELSSSLSLRDELFEREREMREKAERATQDLLVLSQVSANLAETLDCVTALKDVAQVIVVNLADGCVVDLEEEGELRTIAVAHRDPATDSILRELQERFPPRIADAGGVGEVVRTGRPVRENATPAARLEALARSPEHLDLMRRVGFSACLILPLTARDRTLGAITLLRSGAGGGFGPAEAALADLIASRAALCVDNAALLSRSRQENEELKRAQNEARLLNDRLTRAMVETHHRVKNNLQIITGMIDIRLIDWPETVPADDLRRVMSQIKLLARIHDLLTQAAAEGAADRVNVADALQKILEMLRVQAHGRRLQFEVDEAIIPAKQATALALIVNELVSNAFKHSKQEIEVGLHVEDGPIPTATLSVLDDGPGYPADFDPSVHASTGIDLVESLSRWDLAGRVTYANRPEGGAQVTVEFPIPQPTAAV